MSDVRRRTLPTQRVVHSTSYVHRWTVLKTDLRTSPCVFRFIVNSVPIVDCAGNDGDNWNGYASQRHEILDHVVSNRSRGVVWLSGDVHFGGMYRVEPSGAWSNIWEVIMGPLGADRDGASSLRAGQWPVTALRRYNYTGLRADPMIRTLTVEFLNAAGERIVGSRWSQMFCVVTFCESSYMRCARALDRATHAARRRIAESRRESPRTPSSSLCDRVHQRLPGRH